MAQSAGASWLPQNISGSKRIVLLVLDGLGYFQLLPRLAQLPALSAMELAEAYSVAPTTTATALTSLTTGVVPAEHGVVGYRVKIGYGNVLNTLRWTCNDDQAAPTPIDFQPITPFLGVSPVVVTKALYARTAFTQVHLRGARFSFWNALSSLVTRISDALNSGEKFVYAYYEGIDVTAHEFGLDDHYQAELELVDYLLGCLFERLPADTSVVVTADHGQVEVLETPIRLDPELMDLVVQLSGEGRFRWLHVRNGYLERAHKLAEELYGDRAAVMTREEIVERGLFGGPLTAKVQSRLGDLALIATDACSFYDPQDTGAFKLVCRHGALTAKEVMVPVLSYRS
jgi:predicted AlkP superfamily pyrophosphatase or phosphodiesterase